MEEIEVKIIEIDKDETIDKLVYLGAEKIFEGEIFSQFYDKKDNSLSEKGIIIRLRKNGEKAYFTYKKPISQDEAKIVEEYEKEVDFITMHTKLLQHNYKPIQSNMKFRITYRINDVLFEIDEHDNIPLVLEIEAPNIETINKYVEKLGFSKEKVKPWTTKELFEYYKKE